MNASSEGRVTPYFYSPAASGVKIVICAPPPPGEEEFGRNAPKRLIVSQSCAEDIFGPKARMLAQCNNWWAVQDSNLRPPACKYCSHEESNTYAESYELRLSATDVAPDNGFRECRRNG